MLCDKRFKELESAYGGEELINGGDVPFMKVCVCVCERERERERERLINGRWMSLQRVGGSRIKKTINDENCHECGFLKIS